jgi:AraC family transcriptional regulator, regulatory protein of adaptative response / DNA-3-methyladenine glycosylase II
MFPEVPDDRVERGGLPDSGRGGSTDSDACGRTRVSTTGEVVLTLPVSPPFDGGGVLRWAALHAVPSRDELHGAPAPVAWSRASDDQVVRMTPSPEGLELRAAAAGRGCVDVGAATALVRRAFDLEADVGAVQAALGTDPLLGPLLHLRPGVRIPGAPDPFEGAVRVVLGQQVSARGATTLMGRLADLHDGPGLPPPGAVAELDLERRIGVTRQRGGAVRALAAAVAEGLDLSPGADSSAAAEALVALPGIGPWTAQTILLVVLGEPDAWPTGDLALRRSVGVLTGTTPTARELDAVAERWRPWRGYAALWLWHAHLDP